MMAIVLAINEFSQYDLGKNWVINLCRPPWASFACVNRLEIGQLNNINDVLFEHLVHAIQ
jgi:hypothetical protein